MQAVVERLASWQDIRVLFLSADVADDPRWDLANPSTFSALMELCEGGWVDIVLGGPPARPGPGPHTIADGQALRLCARGYAPGACRA